MSVQMPNFAGSFNIEQLSVGAILETLPHGVLLLDELGQLAYLNAKFNDLTGYTFQYLAGLSHLELMPRIVDTAGTECHSPGKGCNLTAMQTEAVTRHKLRHKEGYLIPVDISRHPVRDKAGKFRGSLLVCKDLGSELLVKIISTINSSLQLRDVLDNTTRAVVDYLGLSSNAIFLLDREAQELKLISCNVFEEEDMERVVIPVGVGAPGIIARDKKPLYVANLKEDPLIDDYARTRHQAKSSIGYPLVCRDELFGVIAFDAETVRTFSPKELDLFESIAGQVAFAIHNAQLFSKLQHLSITDGLTGLYNHRYFQDRLVEELDRARRNKGCLGLLMLDIDHFKKYNDSFGHPQGDELLKTMARVIKGSVRKFDVVCRYGGEEFAVILPDCAEKEACTIAERIRSACENYSFQGCEQQPGGRLTLSIGVSGYPGVQTKREIIHCADRALYVAKSYNNRVECYR